MRTGAGRADTKTHFPFARLRSPWLIRRESWGGFVFDPFPGGGAFRLARAEMETLDCLLSGGCAGEISPRSLPSLLDAPFLDVPRETRGRLETFLAACADDSAEGPPPRRSASLPLKTTFLVTDECPRKCPWCCVRTVPPGKGLSRRGQVFPAASELDEIAAPGGAGFHLHGGEPLLCEALPAFISTLAERNFVVSLSTRAVRPVSYWREMKEAGLALLQLSWEPARDELPAFARTVAETCSAGLDVVVNVVMTSDAVRDATEDVLGVLLAEGAREVRFAPLLPSLFNPAAASFAASEAEVKALRARAASFGGKALVERDSAAPSEVCLPDPAILCTAADGFLYPCDRTAFLERYRLADWRSEGLLAAWRIASTRRRPFPCPFGREESAQ